jgi:hypothetical protein
MGRELKRVQLDFTWPLNERWSGFVNPHYAKSHNCTACNGAGETTAKQRVGDLVSLLMLSGTDAIRGACHPYLQETPLYNTQGKTCGKDMAEFTASLAGRTPSSFGHDSCDKWTAKKKIIAAAGLPENWGICPACEGEGTIWESEESKQAAEDWTPTEPPTGDGYQIWETVSEGSPISPVFATPEELARYMATTRWGADKDTSSETWLRFINGPGWAPSMVMDANGIRTGSEAAF